MDGITQRFKICKPLVVYRLHCMALYHSQTQRHVINVIKVTGIDTPCMIIHAGSLYEQAQDFCTFHIHVNEQGTLWLLRSA